MCFICSGCLDSGDNPCCISCLFVFVINLPFVVSINKQFFIVICLGHETCLCRHLLEFVIIANSGFISMAAFFNYILHFHFGHGLESFRRLIQSVCHTVSSHHCNNFVFYAIYVSLCVAFPKYHWISICLLMPLPSPLS